MITLYKGDCLEKMKDIPDKSVDLVLTDPPYNIKLAEWDTWKTYDAYISFMLEVFKQCERVLKDNGSLYFFHNDMLQIALLMNAIYKETQFNFNSFIIWDKGDFRAQAWKYPTENNNLRSWFNTCEYCLYYNKRSGVSTEWDRTGLERVMLDPNNFKTLRKYSYEMLLYIGGGGTSHRKKLTNDLDTDAQNICSIAKKKVLKKIGGAGDHFTRYGSTQWDLCTKEVYEELTKVFNLRAWKGFREYESLRQEYESLRFTHNLDFNHNNILRYKRDTGDNFHPCQKPLGLLERLIKCSTNNGDTVLDCFMGSGSAGVAAVNLDRNFIGIEKDLHYFEIAQKRIKDAQAQGHFNFD